MNIDELLKDSATVKYAMDGGRGKKGSIKMVSPTCEIANQIRADFYNYGKRLSAARAMLDRGDDYAGTPLPSDMETCSARAVLACIDESDPLRGATEEQMKLFLRRIGGEDSDVVKFALTVCGVASFEDADTQGEHLDP